MVSLTFRNSTFFFPLFFPYSVCDVILVTVDVGEKGNIDSVSVACLHYCLLMNFYVQ